MVIRRFLWDDVDDCVLAETDETGAVLVTYTHEPGAFGPLLNENRGGTKSYYHFDALGTTSMLMGDTGAVTDTFSYDAWGSQIDRTGTTPTPYTWIGRWGYQDDTATNGGYYIRARTYQPTVARWMSVDPWGFVDSINQYLYVQTAPNQRRDPSGLAAVCCKCSFTEDFSTIYQYFAVACLSSSPACCRKECCSHRYQTSHHGLVTGVYAGYSLFPPGPPTTRPKKNPLPPTAVGYGHYCGPTRKRSAYCIQNHCGQGCFSSGVPDYKNNPAPIDALDSICEIHDCCLASWQFVSCGKECNKRLCPQVRGIDCNTMYPDSDPAGQYACARMRTQFLTAFC